MSDLGVQPAADVAPGLSQMQRLTNTFTAPSKTFEDIKRGNRSWWLPFLIGLLMSYLFFAAITVKIGWHQVAENMIRLNPKAEERMSGLTPEQREGAVKMTENFSKYPFLASPVLSLGFAALFALIFWGTINFGFGGRATFGKVFAVVVYGTLPMLFSSLLGIIVMYVGLAPESFNLENPSPVSVGSFLSAQDVGPVIYSLASRLDFTVIWSMVLIAIGLSIVAGVKRSAGYISVFSWWALMVVVRLGFAALFG